GCDPQVTAIVGDRDGGGDDLLGERGSQDQPSCGVWFLAGHLVSVPAVRLGQPQGGVGDAPFDRQAGGPNRTAGGNGRGGRIAGGRLLDQQRRQWRRRVLQRWQED